MRIEERLKGALAGLFAGIVCIMVAGPARAFSGPLGRSVSGVNREGSAASEDGIWMAIDEGTLLVSAAERWIVPRAYRTFRLDTDALQSVLSKAPLEFTDQAVSTPIVATIPMPDGKYARFRIHESPIMEPSLAAQFPEIRTYSGQGIDDPTSTARFDWTQAGFHAMVLGQEGTVFVDPYSRGDVDHYISYDTRDFKKSGDTPPCLVGGLEDAFAKARVGAGIAVAHDPLHAGAGSADHGEAGGADHGGAGSVDISHDSLDRKGRETEAAEEPGSGAFAMPLTPVGSTLRTYRLAQAVTGEYTQFHGGTVNAGLAAVTTSINRVTGIYERDFAIRLVLIANESSIIYTDGTTDPYSNGSPSTLLSQNQTNLDAVIGSANYDIGHIFGTAGGGLAALGVVCAAGNKAKGETGISTPVGDPFDVDYVAHEMGHQFGATHTFNGTTGSCNGNRTSSSAYEPGSGSTIMAYAGICGAEDLQPNSNDYFHTRSYDEIVAFVAGGGSCSSNTATGNSAPMIDAGPNFTIPMDTPFVLTPASASDPDGDALTYCWEEFDHGTAAPPNTDDGTRAIFRSFLPSASPSRTFPKLSDILLGSAAFGESLPVSSRTMNFRVTARDNRAGGGGVDRDVMQVVSRTSSGPFVVTQPNTSVTWFANSTRTVSWNVAGTASAPVSTANVRILISTDGGLTFPTVLAESTPNDGAEAVTVPDMPTSTARVKVEAIGNIFFDISNVDFTISADTLQPFLSLGEVTATPLGGDGDAFLEPGESGKILITLVNDGTTAATNVSATLASSTPGVTVVTTQPIPYPDLPPGGSGTNAIPFKFTVSSSVPCGQSLSFTITANYAEAGGPAVLSLSAPTGELATSTFSYAGPPVPIPDNNALGAIAVLPVSGLGSGLSDVNLRIDGTSCSAMIGSTTVGLDHSWVGDLTVDLSAPAGQGTVRVMNRPGGGNNSGKNFCQTLLDDSAAASVQTITPAGNPYSGAYKPNELLSAFNGIDPNGVWTLKVVDAGPQDTGNIRSWSLVFSSIVCNSPPPSPGGVPTTTTQGVPLTVARSGGDLTLTWGASCSPSGVDYAIYQGTLGSFYSHSLKFCTTQGLQTRTFAGDPGNLYFLVVPLTADSEGSYGRTGGAVERPPGAPACRPQLLGGCP